MTLLVDLFYKQYIYLGSSCNQNMMTATQSPKCVRNKISSRMIFLRQTSITVPQTWLVGLASGPVQGCAVPSVQVRHWRPLAPKWLGGNHTCNSSTWVDLSMESFKKLVYLKLSSYFLTEDKRRKQQGNGQQFHVDIILECLHRISKWNCGHDRSWTSLITWIRTVWQSNLYLSQPQIANYL